MKRSKRLVWNKECKASSSEGVKETGLEQRLQSQFLILSKRLVWNKECKASSSEGVKETGLEQRMQGQFFRRSERDWFGTKNAKPVLDIE